jgi:hypothetical protein
MRAELLDADQAHGGGRADDPVLLRDARPACSRPTRSSSSSPTTGRSTTTSVSPARTRLPRQALHQRPRLDEALGEAAWVLKRGNRRRGRDDHLGQEYDRERSTITDVTRSHYYQRKACCTVCRGYGRVGQSRVEREAPTLWVPSDVGLVEVSRQGVVEVKRAPTRKTPKTDHRRRRPSRTSTATAMARHGLAQVIATRERLPGPAAPGATVLGEVLAYAPGASVRREASAAPAAISPAQDRSAGPGRARRDLRDRDHRHRRSWRSWYSRSRQPERVGLAGARSPPPGGLASTRSA